MQREILKRANLCLYCPPPPQDLGIVLSEGAHQRFPLPLSAAAHQQFLLGAAMGLGRQVGVREAFETFTSGTGQVGPPLHSDVEAAARACFLQSDAMVVKVFPGVNVAAPPVKGRASFGPCLPVLAPTSQTAKQLVASEVRISCRARRRTTGFSCPGPASRAKMSELLEGLPEEVDGSGAVEEIRAAISSGNAPRVVVRSSAYKLSSLQTVQPLIRQLYPTILVSRRLFLTRRCWTTTQRGLRRFTASGS